MGRRKIYVEEDEEDEGLEEEVVQSRFFFRTRVLGALAMISLFAYGSHRMWQRYRPVVAQSQHYIVTADQIYISQPPPWIRSDIRHEVLRNAGLVGGVSVLDFSGPLRQQLRDAFSRHPWVFQVGRTEVELPAAIKIELTYRQPIAAVEVEGPHGVELVPVDPLGVRLPGGDLTDVEKYYLPRIRGAFRTPLVGRVWEEPHILSAIRLAIPLGKEWHPLQLAQIVPVHQANRGSQAVVPNLEIVTNGGTRILWGAPPGMEGPGELPFAEKLQRLQEYANQFENLGSIDGPELIDLRQEIKVQPREARRPSAPQTARRLDEVLLLW